MSNLDYSLLLARADRMPRTIAGRTRRIYDTVASVYPVSTFFFHSKAHACALQHAGIRNGMRVLEVATGSGEMFRRLVKANPDGKTFGLDLSPNMAARTQLRARREFPQAHAHCGAVDVRNLPFRSSTLRRRGVLLPVRVAVAGRHPAHACARSAACCVPGGTFSLVVIGQNVKMFNRLYSVGGSLVPAFWGRQVECAVPDLIREAGMRILSTHSVRQTGYPSRVLVARR